MARTKQIDYERVTFSFPKATLQLLRLNVPKQNMSKFVAEAVEAKVTEENEEVSEFMQEIEELQEELAKNRKDLRPSIEILREIRQNE